MKVLRIAVLAALAVVCAFSQSPEVTTGFGPPLNLWTILPFYDGSGNLQYLCKAKALQQPTSFSVAASTLTNIVVSSNTATITWPSGSCGAANGCGFQVSNQLVVSGSATTALNGNYPIVAVVTATTATFTTSGVSNGTYTDMTITTQSPSSSRAVWSIEKITNSDGSPNLVSAIQWAIFTPSNTGAVCDNRATLYYQ